MLTFFGLTSKYRNVIFQQIHDLVYHGGGGFIHSEVYNMPVWMRKFHIQSINKYLKEKSDQQKQQNQQNSLPSNKVVGPNIKPSSTYNFKK
jgi:hypothetical protein